jgi:hypothetical protein
VSVTLLLDGLDDLRKALQDMPDALTNDAIGIVAGAAHDCADELKTVYPPGPMADHVVVEDRSQQYQARFVVESTTEQAVWWEFGTQNRQTQQGWNRGSEPAHPQRGLISLARKHRVTMRAELVALVQEAGFDVRDTGD